MKRCRISGECCDPRAMVGEQITGVVIRGEIDDLVSLLNECSDKFHHFLAPLPVSEDECIVEDDERPTRI